MGGGAEKVCGSALNGYFSNFRAEVGVFSLLLILSAWASESRPPEPQKRSGETQRTPQTRFEALFRQIPSTEFLLIPERILTNNSAYATTRKKKFPEEFLFLMREKVFVK
jgi:hypothetical protein